MYLELVADASEQAVHVLDGEVLLSIARDGTNQTKVFRIENPDPVGYSVPTIAGALTLAGAIHFPPRVAGQRYWFVRTNSTNQTPMVDSPERLVLSPSSWATLGASF
jgi:hypothetical protein